MFSFLLPKYYTTKKLRNKGIVWRIYIFLTIYELLPDKKTKKVLDKSKRMLYNGTVV